MLTQVLACGAPQLVREVMPRRDNLEYMLESDCKEEAERAFFLEMLDTVIGMLIVKIKKLKEVSDVDRLKSLPETRTDSKGYVSRACLPDKASQEPATARWASHRLCTLA
jgi:hypothetical protein